MLDATNEAIIKSLYSDTRIGKCQGNLYNLTPGEGIDIVTAFLESICTIIVWLYEHNSLSRDTQHLVKCDHGPRKMVKCLFAE